MSYKIQLNQSGTHFLDITEENLNTIQQYSLFRDLVDSNGYIDENVLNKLKLNIHSLIASREENCKNLLDLCIDIIYHDKMKAYGLNQLILLYAKWLDEHPAPETTEEEGKE